MSGQRKHLFLATSTTTSATTAAETNEKAATAAASNVDGVLSPVSVASLASSVSIAVGDNADDRFDSLNAAAPLPPPSTTPLAAPPPLPRLSSSPPPPPPPPLNSTALATTCQLQRVASRCSCQLFFCYYSDLINMEKFEDFVVPQLSASADASTAAASAAAAGARDERPLGTRREDVDCFTLRHNILEVCTNAEQYQVCRRIYSPLKTQIFYSTITKLAKRKF